MKKVIVVIGTRPEAIKLAPLVLALQNNKEVILSVCKTGQHTDMVDSVLDIFGIRASEDFSVMGKTDNLNDTMAFLLQKFQIFFAEFKPDVVFVQGDTVSVFAAAVAAFHQKIDIAHVEAGLRTGNLNSPWPEEGLRSMISPITTFHFAPTEQSFKNLVACGVSQEKIFVTGNTVIDSLYLAEKIIKERPNTLDIPAEIASRKNQKMILITGHRRENFGSGLDNLCKAISLLASKYQDIDFVFPVHLNPTVQKQVYAFFANNKSSNVILTKPQAYLEFVWLMKNSLLIITDSGGIQEEAPSFGVPVFVTRDTTERPEGLKAGCVRLVGTNAENLFKEVSSVLDDQELFKRMAQVKNPYGDGTATTRILKAINLTI